jgi:hypothetical protein
MRRVLHDWDLDEKKMLLAKAYAALPKGGALIIYESLIDVRVGLWRYDKAFQAKWERCSDHNGQAHGQSCPAALA